MTHVRVVDGQLNRTVMAISGTLVATPLPCLLVLYNIGRPKIQRRTVFLRCSVSSDSTISDNALVH